MVGVLFDHFTNLIQHWFRATTLNNFFFKKKDTEFSIINVDIR